VCPADPDSYANRNSYNNPNATSLANPIAGGWVSYLISSFAVEARAPLDPCTGL
jgi:hypothetical protein